MGIRALICCFSHFDGPIVWLLQILVIIQGLEQLRLLVLCEANHFLPDMKAFAFWSAVRSSGSLLIVRVIPCFVGRYV